MKTVLNTLIIMITFFTMGHMPVAEAAQNKVGMRTIRRMIKDGTFDKEQTCLDEYAKMSTRLSIKAGLTPPVGAGVSVGAFYGAAYATAASVTGLGGIIAVVFMAALGFMAAAVGVIGYETYNIARLVRNNFVAKSLAEAYDAKGKHFDKFVRKYFRKYKSDRKKTDSNQIAAIMLKGDIEGAFCNGTASGSRSNRLKKRLAKKKHMFRYIHNNIQ